MKQSNQLTINQSEEYKITEITSENVQNLSEDYLYKVIIIGDCAVGKSNILSRFISNKFYKESQSTIGVELSTKYFQLEYNKNNTQVKKIIKMNIWDTAGQEKYTSITNVYYNGTQGAFIVYDITRKETFDNIEKWLSDIYTKIGNKIPIIIIGNKSDLYLLRKVKLKYAKMTIGQKYGINIYETSAFSSDTSIKELFKKMITLMYNNTLRGDNIPNLGFGLNKNNNTNSNDLGCC